MSDVLRLAGEALRRPLITISGTPISLATIIIFVLIAVITYVVSRLAQRGLLKFFKVRGVRDEGTLGVSTRLLHYLIMFVGLGVAFHTLGINLTALFAAGAVFAIGLGFAMQNIAQNFVAGIILLVERTIKPGDILGVKERIVRVVSIGARATVVRTLDDEDLIVPNSVLVQDTVKNYTLRDPHFRLRAAVGVVYGSDVALVQETLTRMAAELPWRVQEREPVVILTGFGSSSVDFEVSVWIDNPWRVRRTRSMLLEAVWWAFQKAGITIAFPQLDVHFDEPVVDSLRELARAG